MSQGRIGIDEAGRGPLAGPVVAAAVCLREPVEGLNDSKKLNANKRSALFALLRERAIIGIGAASVTEIDRLNIHHATLLAMQRAFDRMQDTNGPVIIDGKFVPPKLVGRAQALVGGDRLVSEVMAASIVAKVTRDRIMSALHKRYPVYGWEQNAGYPVPQHRNALQLSGLTRHHRRSYSTIRRLLQSG